MKIAFLVSGGGGNLKFIYNCVRLLQLDWSVCAVIADRRCDGLAFAQKEGIFSAQVEYTAASEREFDEALCAAGPDVVITNIHKVLSKATLESCPTTRFVNLHYSLLPAFGAVIGMAPLRQAQARNSRFIGVTTHDVIEEVDAGRIISQAVLSPRWNDFDALQDTVFKVGALTLLGTLLQLSSSTGTEPGEMVINDFTVLFSDYRPEMHRIFDSGDLVFP